MNKPWFPQQNTLDAPLAILKNFIFHINFPISRLTIENDTKAHPKFPYLSFGDVQEILEKWGIKSIAFNSTIEEIKDIPVPSILFIDESIGNLKSGNFVMLFEVKENTIEYLHSRKGWVIEDLVEFNKKWAKAALSLLSIESKGEPDFEIKEKEYLEKKNSNPEFKNIRIKDDFLTDEECAYLIELGNANLKRSALMGETNVLDYGRTSYSAEFHVFPNDEVLNSIRKRASELIKMPESHFEHFQCVSYNPNQEYMNHYDTFDETSERGRKTIEEGGQRKYTMLVYLNDDFIGGGTHFPNLDLLVMPKKKRVVMFNNLDENGKILKASFHAGLPVTTGRKYAINIWVRNKPCR